MGKASRKKRSGGSVDGGLAGTTTPTRSAPPYISRPFEGLPGETDWVALREIVPAASASVRLRAKDLPADVPPEAAGQEVTICTVLPMAWPALRRADGQVLVALQTIQSSGDASRDVAAALLAALAAEPGAPVATAPQVSAETPRLQELLDTTAPFEVSVHEGFDFWVSSDTELDADGKASLEAANEGIIPTTKLAAAESAYWCRIGERTHIRWLLPLDEDVATNALARLHAAGADVLGEGTRLLGAFRAGGLLVPVWDLDPAKSAADYEKPMAAFAKTFAKAVAVKAPLSADERRARNGLLSRQLTIR